MTINSIQYFLTLLILLISGCPAVDLINKELLYTGSFVIFVVAGFYVPSRINRRDLLIYGVFFGIGLMHFITFGSLTAISSIGFLVRLGIALLAAKIIHNFSYRYVTIMSVLSGMSLIFFIPTFMGVDTQDMFSVFRIPTEFNYFHIGVHNFSADMDGRVRNSGLFWEPGAFAGYLVLALFFLIRDGLIDTVLSTRGVLLVITLISTQSTTGYVALMVLILLFIYRSGWIKSRAAKILVVPIFFLSYAISTLLLFSEVDFLGEKIDAQLESAAMQDNSSRINRFGNFLYDSKWIISRPLLGWSATPQTRVSVDPEVLDLVEGQGNGLAGFTIKFGLIGLLVFLGLFAFNTHRNSGSAITTFLGMALVCILLTGEQFLNFPFFLSLMFSPEVSKRLLPDVPRA